MQKKFYEVTNEWLMIKKLAVKYSTYIKYENVILKHLNIKFNDLFINDINEEIIMTYFHELLGSNNYSINTLKVLRYVLKSILDYAQIKYNIPSINFNFIKLKKTNKIAKVLTAKESRALETYCFQHQKNYSVAILLSLYGGFRLGEVAGLKWEDIDFQNGLIHVNRTIERLKTTDNQNKTQLMVLEPKTHTSKRIVPIPDFVLKFLKIYYQNQDDVESNHYVYTGSCKIPDPRNIQYHYNKICKLLNFQSHYHSLRHTYATNCVMNNIDVKSLSEMLGHSSVSITLELYVHSSLEFKKDQINKLKIPSHIAELCVL